MEKSLKIAVLDAGTLGEDIDLSMFDSFGRVEVYEKTDRRQIRFRVADSDVVIVNKLPLNEETLGGAKDLKLICVTATGYDNIDLEYCRKKGIGVCNVRGYSSESVAQVTMAMALSLVNHIKEYNRYVTDGSYTRSGRENSVSPVFHELSTLTWGIVGLGAIGKRVAQMAKSLGFNVIAYNRSVDALYNCVDLDTLCQSADVISIHLPLTDETRSLINNEKIAKMKKSAIIINVARGAVVDESALCNAVLNGSIGGIGVDVYSHEPMDETSPYNMVNGKDNVILTPHMAWATYEARMRCMREIAENIEVFIKGGKRNRVDI